MTLMHKQLILFLPFFASRTTTIVAWPTTPGSCKSPVPVGGIHNGGDFVGGTALSDFGLVVTIDGETLDPMTPYTITDGASYSIELKAASNSDDDKFRGFLMRLADSGGAADVTEYLSTDHADAQHLFDACGKENAAGIGHNFNDLKERVSGTLDALEGDAVTTLSLEVTAVIHNGVSAPGSGWYTSAFEINVKSPTSGAAVGMMLPSAMLLVSTMMVTTIWLFQF